MRPIKFKVWDRRHERMITWTELVEDFNCIVFTDEHYEPLEYIGLKDKNSVEIYESDLVKTPAGIGEVVWDKCFRLMWDGGGLTTLHDCEAKQLEVIGNIYENKELLNEDTTQ